MRFTLSEQHWGQTTVKFCQARNFGVRPDPDLLLRTSHALACTGDYDLVCCGHDHKSSVSQVATVKGGQTWLINPGTVGGVGAPPTYIMADLATMQFEVVTIDAAPTSVLPPVTPHI